MKKSFFVKLGVAVGIISMLGAFSACSKNKAASKKVTLTNVSYDPTRELYQAYNQAFAKYYKEKKGIDVEISQSHGGSGKQALEVANGNDADVVTLALEWDVQAIADAGRITDKDWVKKFPLESSPYTSTIVFLVRKGNPKNIKDWDDVVKPGIGVITPNPKTSGGARWNYLAAWAYAEQHNLDAKDFIKKLYKNVVVLDSGARGATNSFVQNKQGDVLLAWENEAFLSIAEDPDGYEIVTPSISILAQPSVAIVDEVVDARKTRQVATDYLNYLYSDEAQRIEGQNFYRPSNTAILKEFSNVFDLNVTLVTIKDFGGWAKAQKEHFADGGIFDQIYEKK
ncbi:MAG: sulfate ABC transporter substrate-binding protein [Treponema sp.]|nr:sulfate ABC transporter substrate-binding protein [Treponema sp.]